MLTQAVFAGSVETRERRRPVDVGLEKLVRQYRKAGGKIDMTVFEGEGEGLLRDLSSPTAQQALEQMVAFIHQHLG